MKYADGNEVLLGDQVKLWEHAEGTVVCSMETNHFTDSYSKNDWGYLKDGVLIASPDVGLIHYLEPDHSLELIKRNPQPVPK